MSTEASAPEVPAQEPKPEAQPAAQPQPQPDEKKPDRVFTQAELDEIVEKRLAKERRKREDTKKENEVLRKLALERGEQPTPKKEAPAEDREPVRSDFETYEDFLAARADYRAGKTAKSVIAEERKEAERKAKEEADAKAAAAWREKVNKNSEGIADFSEVMANLTPDMPVAKLPSDPIGECDNPAKVLYHLATHPEEAERIASLPLGQQARAIWKLDTDLASAKPPVKPSKAPAPISPNGGGNAKPVGEMPDPNTDQAGWLAWRNAQVRLARKGA